MGDDWATVETDPIDVAWQRLQTAEAYWAGFSGMLIGGLIYSLLLSLVMAVLTYGVVGVVIVIGGTFGFLGLIGVIGVLFFLVVRAINASLGWLLPSRYAAATAAGLTGLFLFFLPLFAVGDAFQKGVNAELVCFGPVILMTFLQAGAWLATDRDIRKFEQRVAFSKSDKVVAKRKNRFGIGRLLLCTFWLAGVLAIFGAIGRLNDSPERNFYVLIALFITVFLSLGFSVILVFLVKSLRWLQKKTFYRKRSVGN